jgi:hypothetical protein
MAPTISSETRVVADDARNKWRRRIGFKNRMSHVVVPQPKNVMTEEAIQYGHRNGRRAPKLRSYSARVGVGG